MLFKHTFFSISIILYMFLTSCNSDYAGTISEVEFEVTGILLKSDGSPAYTNVYLINAGDSNTYTDTLLIVTTDSVNGSYHFLAIDDTIRSFRIFSQQDSFFVAIDTLREKDTLIDMGIDTLRLPGGIKGFVETEDGTSPLGILAFIPALSSAVCPADTNGYFEITNLPSNRFYTITFKEYGYTIVSIPDIFIEESDTFSIPTVTLLKKNSPKKPSLSYDTLNNIILINWEPMSDSTPDGYIVFRKDSLLTAKYPSQLNKDYLISSSPFQYIDTLGYDLFTEKDTIIFEYKIKGVFGDDRTPFSDAATVSAVISSKGGIFTNLQIDSNISEIPADDSLLINWQSRGTIDSVSLFISVDSMKIWTTLASNIPNSGSYSCIAPSTETDFCFIKIDDADINHNSSSLTSKKYSIVDLNPTNLLKNGNFDLGNAYWNGVAVTNSGANAIFSFNENCTILISDTSGKESDIRLSQTEIPLKKDTDYTISFNATVNENKNITFISCSRWTVENGITGYAKESILLIPEKEQYSIDFSMTEESDTTASIIFDVGASLIDISFDDIILFKR